MQDEPSVCLGETRNNAAIDGLPTTLVIDNKNLKSVSNHPAFLHYIKKHHDVDAKPRPQQVSKEKCIPLSLLGRHGIIVGASGSGKSFLALHLLREQLAAGLSAVVIDVKTKTLERALSFALEAGLKPNQITTILPRNNSEGTPGWNPLYGDVATIRERVSEFKDILRLGSDSWGPRMDNLLESAATVMAAEGLSLLEMYEFLLDEEYRSSLLQAAKNGAKWEEFKLRYEYFEREFPTIAKTESVQAVLSRIRMLVDNKYLRTMFCAARDTLDLPSLWQRQRLILVHMDSSAIGDEGVRFLAGLLSESLLRAALKQSGPVPVLLFLDEMGYQSSYLGRSLTKILAIAREQNLRLLIAVQHLGQLSPELKEAALTSTAFRAFFQLGDIDADYVTKRIGHEVTDELRRVAVKAEDETIGYGYKVEAYHRERKAYEVVKVPLHHLSRKITEQDDGPINLWSYFIILRRSGYLISEATPPRVSSANKIVPVADHLRGLTCALVALESEGYTVSFPRFKTSTISKVSRSERLQEITHMLATMPTRHAIMKSGTPKMQYIVVKEVIFPQNYVSLEDYCGTGQTATEIKDNFEERLTVIARLKHRATASESRNHDVKKLTNGRTQKPGVFKIPELRDFPYTSKPEALDEA